jgi:hypothetical protein
MKAEIKLTNIGNIGVSTAMKDGILLGKITCQVIITPFDVARLLNFQKQHADMNLVIESPQAVMDFEMLGSYKDEGLVPVMMLRDEGTEPVVAFNSISMKYIEATDDEPAYYQVEIDGYSGYGQEPNDAIIAALATAGIINLPEVGSATVEDVVHDTLKVLAETYPVNTNAAIVALALQKNSIDVDGSSITFTNTNDEGESGKEEDEEKSEILPDGVIYDVDDARYRVIEGRTDSMSLCNTCDKHFSECGALYISFGTADGNDNVIVCDSYKTSQEPFEEKKPDKPRRQSRKKEAETVSP